MHDADYYAVMYGNVEWGRFNTLAQAQQQLIRLRQSPDYRRPHNHCLEIVPRKIEKGFGR